jgi:predicted kinase
MKQFLLVIRGASGSGKSTLSKAIQEKIGEKVAILKADYFYWKVCPQDRNKHLDENPIVYVNLLDLAENYLGEGYSVIIEGLLNRIDDFKLEDELQKLSSRFKVTYKRFYLGVDLETARIRHQNSDFSIPIEEVEGWAKGREMKVNEKDIVIDTVKISQEELAKTVLEAIN